MSLLRVKAALVGTPLESIATRIRWNFGAIHRYRFPEMREASLEEQRLPAVLKKLLPQKNANCIDIGCHIGGFLSLLLKLFPDGQHLAVEASPTKAEWLKRKFSAIPICNVAIADRKGIATFEDNAKRPGFSRLLNGGERDTKNSYYEVSVTTLDELLAAIPHIDLLKIDIEGGELNALKGATETIARTRPAILFEVGSEYGLEKMHISRRELYDFLTQSLGYEVYTFSDFLFDKGPMEFSEFRKCGLWPFRAFNFIAKPQTAS